MSGDDFKELTEKINNIDKNVIEIKIGLEGHANRIDKCEDDRKELFSTRNKHELQLTELKAFHKAEELFSGRNNRNTGKTFDWIMRILMALFALITLIFIVFKSFPVHGAEKCPVQNQSKTEREIQDIVRIFNECPVAINYGMFFECKDATVLECHLPLTTDQCLELRVKIKGLATGISGDWFNYTGSKIVYVYNLEAILIYYIKSNGEFKCIFDGMI